MAGINPAEPGKGKPGLRELDLPRQMGKPSWKDMRWLPRRTASWPPSPAFWLSSMRADHLLRCSNLFTGRSLRMKSPQAVRSLDREVRTWTENISDDALADVVVALQRRIRKIDRNYDIPYIAGYSRDGSTVFIDRHMPRSFAYRGRWVQTDRFLVTREIIEKALIDELHLHYLHAHQVALRTEQAAVRAAGIAWKDYNRFTKANEKKIGDERLVRVPRDLDLTPYRDEHDLPELRKIIAASSALGKSG
jgi:hypothetical protein